jgi:ketosteroid isomerase-like protein
MGSIDRIQAPVTGGELNGNQNEASQALSQFYRALNARDLELMQKNWINTAEAAMDNPLGGIKRGWDEIKSVYETLFDSKATYRFEFYDYTMHEADGLFYVVGRERGEVALSGRPLELAIRTTRVFRRDEDGQWRQIHHHGSIDDPRMLAAYQDAVLRKTEKPVLTQAGA